MSLSSDNQGYYATYQVKSPMSTLIIDRNEGRSSFQYLEIEMLQITLFNTF